MSYGTAQQCQTPSALNSVSKASKDTLNARLSLAHNVIGEAEDVISTISERIGLPARGDDPKEMSPGALGSTLALGNRLMILRDRLSAICDALDG